MKVLVTGAAGFIGSNLSRRLLAEKIKVVGLDNLSYGLRSQVPVGVQFCRGDIRSKDIHKHFKGVDAVFHLAAKNCISDCQSDPAETASINVHGTVNVLDACRKMRVKKIICAESAALYEGCDQFPSKEETVDPVSFYGRSKLAARLFMEEYARFYGLKCTALRYFNVYGPYQDYRRTVPPVMSAFILELLKKKRPVIYGTGNKRRDFVYVDDVNDFHLLALRDRRTDGQTYNLGSGINYSVREIYRAVDDLLRTGIRPVFKKDLPGECMTTLADISKARKLGWKPKTSLESGLAVTVEHIRKYVL